MLGAALVQELSTKHEVIALDRDQVDIIDSAKTEALLTELAPNVIINAAAHNAVDQIETDLAVFDLAQKINGYAVGDLARIAKKIGAIIVHFSTDYVFDGAKEAGYIETDAPSPISKYAETKALGETELQKNTFQYYLIRLSRLFGPAGASAGSKKSFVDTMIDLVVNKGKTELKVVDEEVSCPTYSIDLAKTVAEIIDNTMPFGIYHAGGNGTCTWYEFAQEIFKLKQLTVNVIPVTANEFPRPAKRPAFSELKNTKLPTIRSWQEALQEYLNV